MSNAAYPEVGLAADNFLKAIESGLPHLLKHGGEYAPQEEMAGLGDAFRTLASHLIKLRVIDKEKDGDWFANEEVMASLTEDQAKSILPYYDTMVRAHEPVVDHINNSGMQPYVEYFKAMHKPVEFEDEEQTRMVMTDDSKKNIIGSGLNLLDAVHEDPAQGAFLTGASQEDLDALRTALTEANYLTPETKGSARTAPLGDQSLRGTEEQQDAIINQLIAINANIEAPETINQGDRPMMAAAMLDKAISEAEETEAPLVNNYDPVAPNPFNSDLLQEDARDILDLKEAGDRVSMSATIDPQNGENLLVSKAALLALDPYLKKIADQNIDDPENRDSSGKRKDALSSPDFVAPGMGRESAVALKEMIKSLREIRSYQPANALEAVSSDEGGRATESGFDEEIDLDEEDTTVGGSSDVRNGTRAITDRAESDKSVIAQMEEDQAWAKREELSSKITDYVEDLLPEEEEMVSMPMEVLNQFESKSMDLVYKGLDQTLNQIADRDTSLMTSGVERGTNATWQEAMKGGSKSHVTLVNDDFAISLRRLNELSQLDPSMSNSGRFVKIVPNEGFLKDRNYHAPHASNAQSMVNTFVRQNKVDENGNPDIAFRAELKKLARRSPAASSQEEAVAWKLAAMNEVALDKEEQDLRREVLEDKTGKSFIDLDGKSAREFCNYLEASGTKELGRFTIDAEGKGRITHPEGPDLTFQMKDVPEGFGSEKAGRQFGGMIDHKRMQSALEASTEEKGITLVMVGETPKGFISKIDESHTKQREELPIDRHPDMALS